MSAVAVQPKTQQTEASDRLPVAALLAFAMTGFVAIMTETMPAGLLPLIGRGPHVSQGLAGQLVTVYAAGSLVAAIPLVTATQAWRRRPVLPLAIGGLLAFNTVTAVSGFYALTLATRFLAGVAAGLAWMLAHNVLYTYAAPFVARAGLGGRVDLVLLVFGVAAFLGIWITGLVVDRWLRASVLLSLAIFALVCVVLAVLGQSPTLVLGAVAVWGLTFGGASTLLNTASADTAGDAVDVAAAMVTTAWNMAIAGGGIVGALLLSQFGPASFPVAMLVPVLAAIAVVWRSASHGFPRGSRAVQGSARLWPSMRHSRLLRSGR